MRTLAASGPRRRRSTGSIFAGRLFWLAPVLVAVGVFFVLSALGVGRRTTPRRHATSTPAPLAIYSVGAPHVLSSLTVYPREGSFTQPPLSDPPTPPALFKQPIASYRAFAITQLGLMEGETRALVDALETNGLAASRSAWRTVYARYLHLGAVYLVGEVATLNQAIDGNAGGLEGGVANPRFRGLHRIEYGLWTGAPPRSLLGWARQLAVAVHTLRGALPSVTITPLEYATRAHEILEDAQRDLLSGADVPWSGEGVLATDAGLQATEEVLYTLRPLFRHHQLTLPDIEAELATLRAAMASLAAAHGGRLPSNGQLSQSQRELLDGTLGGALEALSLVPVTLETELPPQVPQIPRSAVRIDP